MGGLTGAVRWWDEWQLRVLVLTSLAVQFLLLIFSLLRRVAISGWLRSIMWLAYLGGDAMAIYALATLFNRHKQAPGEDGSGGISRSSSLLDVFWAPILLLHLGGHDGITAYNIEDNELWSRHLLTAVSQVTVAIYVFCKTWPPGGDERLLQAANLLFIPGVLKCFHKPWALKSASIYSLISSAAAVKQEMYPLEEYVKGANVLVREQTVEEGEVQAARASASSITMEDEGRRPRRNDEEPAGTGTLRSVRRAVAGWTRAMLECFLKAEERRQAGEQRIREMYQVHNESSKLFVDLSSPYSRRLSILEHFCGLTEERAYGSVRQGLATAFVFLYTKLKTVNMNEAPGVGLEPPFYYKCIQNSRFVLPWAAIGLFHKSHRGAYNDIDVNITYVLLCCTAALEFFSIYSFLATLTRKAAGAKWPEMVGQRSFIGGYVARSNNKMMRIVSRLLGCCCKDFLDQQHYWRERPCFSSYRITGLVHQYLKDGWKQNMHDAASYRRFNDNRGHWTLEGNELEDHLGWSIKGPFDESVLRWHIATDFCFFSTASSSSSDLAAEVPPTNEAVLCRQMSNYMAYLLLVDPEMLLPGSRRNLCTRAQEELEAIFNNNGDRPPPGLDKRALAEKIVSKLQSSSSSQQGGFGPTPQETFIHEAWKLAQALQKLGDQKMWEVIQGIWVEMLCYSAGRCRGYLHAKALGKGGEFLSYVWLLMFYMGMETFTDKLQREDLQSHEAARTGTGNIATAGPTMASTSEQVSSTTGGTAASASEAHADATGASDPPSTSEIRMAEDMV